MSAQGDCISILQLSDLHILATPEDTLLGMNTEHYFQACLKQAATAKKPFDLMLLTGDLAQDPGPASYRRILTALDSYQTPCICLPGNHDDDEIMQQVFNTERINCRKQVLFHHWQLISLNSQIVGEQGGRLSAEELAFLDQCLTEHPNRHALIAVHHHCLPTDSPWMDTMMIENRDELWELVDQYPQVKAITTGHIHQLMDIKTAHVRVWGTPSTCFQFAPGSTEFMLADAAPGYRLIDLYADGRVESEVVRLATSLIFAIREQAIEQID